MITFYGAAWCPDCLRSKKLLDEKNITYKYVDLDEDETAADKVTSINHGLQSIPTIVFDDGSVLTEPTNQDLLSKLKSLGAI